MSDIIYIPASQTNPDEDVLGNPIIIPSGAWRDNRLSSEINFSPVDKAFPDSVSVPGADDDLDPYDGTDSGDITKTVSGNRESKFKLPKE